MKSLALTIVGPIKGGKNNMGITRTGRHYPKAKWGSWRDGVVLLLLGQNRAKIVFDSPSQVEARYWRGDNRRRDIPAMIDSVWHCLERAGIVEDDTMLEDCDWRCMGLDRERPRLELLISTKEESCETTAG